MALSKPFRLDEKPSLDELGALQTITGEIDVIERISTDYYKFGLILLEDSVGDIVENMRGDNAHKVTRITLEIVRRWLKGTGRKPVTWETLIDVLKKMRLTELADAIQGAPSLTLSAKPSLDELGGLETKKGEIIDVFEKISTDYESFGIKLLQDSEGDIVENLKGEVQKTQHMTRSIVRAWLKGTGKKPVVWRTLIDVLKRIKLQELADDISAALSMTLNGEQNTQPTPTAPATGITHPGGPKGTRGSTLTDSPGVAILITCDYDNSEELDPLPGTKEDAKEMKTTFDFLHYVIHQQHNPTREDMKALLKEVSTSLGSLNMEREVGEEKVIIFAFSGHGRSKEQAEKIYANDGEVLDIKTEVIRPLIRHKGVQYVPKLFFIDACRGSETLISKGGGARNSDDQVAKSDEVYFEKVADHVAGNTYVAYATIPHTVSYAGLNGSMWMPRIARALREQNDAFRVVTGKVMTEVRLMRGEKKQQCESVDRLNIAPLYLQRRL